MPAATVDLSNAKIVDNDSVKHVLTAQRKTEELKKSGAFLKKALEETQRELEEVRSDLDILRGLSNLVLEPIVIDKPKTSKRSQAAAVALVSDLHAFETVKGPEVNGLNKYNIEIARQRITKIFEKIVLLTNIERTAADVDTLILALLGDLMTNQLHRDQVENNAGTPMEEILFLVEILKGGIDYLLERGRFKRIVVPCCDGNHGRHLERMQHSNRVKHSYEWLIYNLLAKQYSNDNRVQFDIAEGQLLYTKIYGKTIRWTHADTVKYKGGVGGLTIPVRRAIENWDKGCKADLTAIAHFHTSYFDRMFVSNGSAIGYAPFSITIKAPFELPQQTFMLLDPKLWITAYKPIYL